MKSEGFKVKFMFSFLGLFVEAHSIFAANNDTMEGSLENLPLSFTDSGHMCNIFLSYYMYRMKKENITKEEKLAAKIVSFFVLWMC